MVQVVIGEQRGEGVRCAPNLNSVTPRRNHSMGCRTFWDRDTDTYASETFINDSIFCVVAAYAVYLC